MDERQLARVALSSLRGDSFTARSSVDATANSMNNPIHHNSSTSHEIPRALPGTDVIALAMGATRDRTLQPASSNNSQSTDGASTPPTDSNSNSDADAFSSQSTGQDSHLSQLSQLSQLAAAQQPMGNPGDTRLNIATAGQKRSADGQIKPPSPPSPHRSHHGHSRNTSAVSNASSVGSNRIGDLSSKLRTRLSYAILKVNKGWEDNSIHEVESLASQGGSPTSSTSTLNGRRNQMTSPRTAMIASSQGHSNGPANAITSGPTGDFPLYSSTEPDTSRTYESFWRSHSTPIAVNPQSLGRVSLAPLAALAPSAEIRPTQSSRRSPNTKTSKPPAMPGHGSNSSILSIPSTPNGSDAQPPQPPSQRPIREQEAIDSLLNMHSPGNAFTPRASQTSPQNSPLRAEFRLHEGPRGVQGKKVNFQQASLSQPVRSPAVKSSYAQQLKVGRKKRSSDYDDIDRMLDELPDSSSDEDDLDLYPTPRRIVGRV